jgi:hypothetical protein
MKRLHSLLFLILATVGISATPSDEVFEHLMAIKAQDADMSVIPEQDVPALKQQFRDIVDRKTHGDYVRARIYLLRMGDANTINELVSQFREYKDNRAWVDTLFFVERARQPLLISAFASELSSSPDEGISGIVGTGDKEIPIIVPSKPNYAGALILKTIITSSEFSSDTQKWATELYSKQFTSDFLKIMRVWWAQNKKFIETMKYGNVTPYVVESDMSKIESSMPILPSPAKSELLHSEAQNIESTPSKVKLNKVSQSPPALTHELTWPCVISFAVLAVFLFAMYWIRKK